MKKDLHNKKSISDIFNESESIPSANSWDKLSALLDEHLPVEETNVISFKSKNNYTKYIGITAALLVVFGIVFTLLSPDKNSVNTTETFVYTENDVLENKPDNVLTQPQNLSTNINTEIIPRSVNNNNIASVAEEKELFVYETQRDSAIQLTEIKTSNEVKIAWDPVNNKQMEIDTRSLLRNVERELINEQVEKELNKPKDRFENIRMAISNRNYEE